MYVKKVTDMSTLNTLLCRVKLHKGWVGVVQKFSSAQIHSIEYNHNVQLVEYIFNICTHIKKKLNSWFSANSPETLSNSFFKYLLLFFNNHVY